MKLIILLYFIIVLISFFIRTIRNVLYQTFLWQLKEYRLDRIIAHLRTSQGRKAIFGLFSIFKWIILLGLLGIIIFYKLEPPSNLSILYFPLYICIWTIWIIEALLNLREFIRNRWRLPKFTPKIIFILGIVFMIQFGLLFSGEVDIYLLSGPFLDKVLAPSIGFLMFVFNIPSYIYKEVRIRRAEKKILKMKNLTVIGITGSYGKTSTKEFLATILSEKFKVAKTPASKNIIIGIAKYILEELKPDNEIFIVEMGAYTKGEIKAICGMVHPKMGIVTGINEQHIELFGSLDKTKQAKYELIESLPDNAFAIFNGDNKHCLEMTKWANKRKLNVLTYQVTKDVKTIKVYKDHLEFTYINDREKCDFKVNLLGRQNIENVLGAILAARSVKIDFSAIQCGVSKIIPPDKTMKLYKTSSGLNLIDDSFNANPAGVEAVIEYMKLYKGKKILVLTPLIELGEESDKVHQKLGKAAAKICDRILLTNPNYEKPFCEGIKETGRDVDKVQIINASEAIDIINNSIEKNGVVVFEGKEAGKILEKLKITNYV